MAKRTKRRASDSGNKKGLFKTIKSSYLKRLKRASLKSEKKKAFRLIGRFLTTESEKALTQVDAVCSKILPFVKADIKRPPDTKKLKTAEGLAKMTLADLAKLIEAAELYGKMGEELKRLSALDQSNLEVSKIRQKRMHSHLEAQLKLLRELKGTWGLSD